MAVLCVMPTIQYSAWRARLSVHTLFTWWRSSTLMTVPTVKNLKCRKSKMAAAAILKKKHRKIAIFRPRFDRFWRNLARNFLVRNFWPSRPLKIWNFKMQGGGGRHLWKIEKSRYLGCCWSDFNEIWHSDAVWPSWTFQPLKIWKF